MKKALLIGLAVAGTCLGSAFGADAGAAWQEHCAACHGRDGTGHTRAGHLLHVKDLASASYQKTFTDDQAFKDVKFGFKDADGNVRMKPFADKLSDAQIKELVAYVRTLAK
jgi:cytochrome c6